MKSEQKTIFNHLICSVSLFVSIKPSCTREWPWDLVWAWVQNKVMILIFIINGYKRLCHSLLLIFNLVDGGIVSVTESYFKSWLIPLRKKIAVEDEVITFS